MFFINILYQVKGVPLFLGGTSGKAPACKCRRCKRHRFDPWVGKIPWRRAWQPTPMFLPGESHGQRNLMGYSPWGCKESDRTKVIIFRTEAIKHTHIRTLLSLFVNYDWLLDFTKCFFCNCWYDHVKVKVAQSCPTLCDPMDYTVQGILQARILEWVVLLFSRGSSQARDQTQVSRIAGGFFTSWATREAQEY